MPRARPIRFLLCASAWGAAAFAPGLQRSGGFALDVNLGMILHRDVGSA